MITDLFSRLREYAGFDKRLEMIAAYAQKNDLAALPCGRYDLDDGVFLNISEYEPYPSPGPWEAHRKYADLQLVLEGNERMDGAPIANAQDGNGYNEEDDFELFETCPGSMATIYAYPGTFALFMPEDAHRPGLHYQSDRVKKAVFKIPV